MIYQNISAPVTIKNFVAHVRKALDDAERFDVRIEKSWLERERQGNALILRVPVGPELLVPVTLSLDLETAKNSGDFLRTVAHTATALCNLRSAEHMLEKYAQKVRNTTRIAVAEAQAEGLDLQLDGIGFKPTSVEWLAAKSWQEAATYVIASARIRHTSSSLKPGIAQCVIEEAEDAADALAPLLDEQRENQQRLSDLEALGADLEVDENTLALLEIHGLDPVNVLREVRKKQRFEAHVDSDGRKAELSVAHVGGSTHATCKIDDELFWNGQQLNVGNSGRDSSDSSHPETPQLDRKDHSLSSGQAIAAVDAAQDLTTSGLSRKFLFDAETGRLWRRPYAVN